MNVLYANADSYGRLDDAAKQVLAAAAAETQKWAIDRTDDVASGKAFCDDGGTLVHASADDLAGLKAATKPVADAIASAHGVVIAEIAALKEKVPSAAIATACTPAAAVKKHAPVPPSPRSTAHTGSPSPPMISSRLGCRRSRLSTTRACRPYVLKDGKIHYALDPSGHEFHPAGTNQPDEVDGTYQIDDEQLTFWFPVFDNEMDRFQFSVTDQGNLKLTLLQTTGDEAQLDLLMAGKIWEQIG